MIDDDELRRALRDAAPDAPDPAAARHRLAPAMTRARRRRRLRTAAGAASLTLAVGLGGAAALDQLSSSDTAEIGPADSLPAPRVGEPATPSSTAVPAPSSTTGSSDTGSSDTGSSNTVPAPPSTLSDPLPSDTLPSDPLPSDPLPSDTGPSAPPTSSTTPVVPAPPTSVSGPHLTSCGSATFVHDGSTVQLADHEVVAGYRFRVESESPTQVEVKWDDGPGEECEIHAHLEGTALVVDGDHDDD